MWNGAPVVLVKRFLFACAFCTLVACDQGPVPPPDWEEAAIQERGVAGIEFGETRDETLARHPSPDRQTLGEGLSGTWLTLWYQSGALAEVQILYLEIPDTTLGAYPADYFNIYAPFQGKTEKGIGIGSSKDEFFEAYGIPPYQDSLVVNVSPGPNRVLGTFYQYMTCLGSRELGVTVREDTVFSMSLGSFVDHDNMKYKCDS